MKAKGRVLWGIPALVEIDQQISVGKVEVRILLLVSKAIFTIRRVSSERDNHGTF